MIAYIETPKLQHDTLHLRRIIGVLLFHMFLSIYQSSFHSYSADISIFDAKTKFRYIGIQSSQLLRSRLHHWQRLEIGSLGSFLAFRLHSISCRLPSARGRYASNHPTVSTASFALITRHIVSGLPIVVRLSRSRLRAPVAP